MSLQVTLKSGSSLFTYLHCNNNETEARAFCASHYPDYKVLSVDELHSEARDLDLHIADSLEIVLTR